MQVERLAAFAPRTRAVADDICRLNGPCIGCTGCNGVCKELLEAMTLPDIVLETRRP